VKKGINVSAKVESELKIRSQEDEHTENLHQDKANSDGEFPDQDRIAGKKQTCHIFCEYYLPESELSSSVIS
jgi:hypothetical protein